MEICSFLSASHCASSRAGWGTTESSISIQKIRQDTAEFVYKLCKYSKETGYLGYILDMFLQIDVIRI